MDTPCILWDGPTFETHGIVYGRIPGTATPAHRAAYEAEHGPIPEGLVIDHLCRVGLCVNALHLEAVTHRVNILRGEGACAKNARKTHCPRNHPLDGDNLVKRKNGRRECKTCNRERQRR